MSDEDEPVIVEVEEEEEPEEEEEEEEEVEEEDPEDVKEALDEECGEAACAKYKAKLDSCTARVEGDDETSETCTEEFIDFMHCVDACTAPKLFAQLK
ncbi:hypothetical protein SARC_05241 [Sphaeroforma arctica JP610]|uniref:Ubiquinol-cytochrome C reductase hinge domain-containing protein n=1 Tax=Sphaeroforma arctica JP610 TaxID=667725 RepID=A0A0L0G0W4_9EUKA|nr:hypothetical protein SARC_05241 [Sphaeroforma arctica JP610]KNC82471.1 hypothetical protein SARC_05241 [Sphaeroforma arctica JP610]|eukprot:XP_014156373.1 hypothetical protein SARC_05241 [Sphaeroforma arctica JP610]